MNVRKEKERDFFIHHMDTFRALGNSDPFFIIKTAFYQKGKFGRQVQFFESEIGKGEDIYIEFYDNVTNDQGMITNVIPFSLDRQLFKYKYNPFYSEEYETKEGINVKGEPYVLYTVPVSEMIAVLKDGTEITYALYEKRKAESEQKTAIENIELPKQQSSLFPDFEESFSKKDPLPELKPADVVKSTDDVPLADMTLRDLASIMLMKPLSNRTWLNDLIKQAKSDI